MVLVTPKESAIKSLEAFIDYCRKNPGRLSLGISAGFNSSSGFVQVKLQQLAGITFNPVPLKGGSDLIVNLLGKHVQAGIGNLGVIMNERDKLNFIAATSEIRNVFIKDIPTFRELGIPIVEKVRRLFVVPKGVDQTVQNILVTKLKTIFDNNVFQDSLMKNGWAPEWISGAELEDIIRKEQEVYNNTLASIKK
jgi:putative tricarboxylic transport membrane protein